MITTTLRERLDAMTKTELRELQEKIHEAHERDVARRAALRQFSKLVAGSLRRKQQKGKTG